MSEDSDRKYRQRGYQDEPRERGPKRGPAGEGAGPARAGTPAAGRGGPADAESDGVARGVPLLALRQPARAAGGGTTAAARRCGVDLHSCVQCVSFDTSARFECTQPTLTARVSPKDARNACALLRPAHHGRAADRHAGPDERTSGVR